MVYQDPYSSLNPRMRARDIIGEPLEVHGDGTLWWRGKEIPPDAAWLGRGTRRDSS